MSESAPGVCISPCNQLELRLNEIEETSPTGVETGGGDREEKDKATVKYKNKRPTRTGMSLYINEFNCSEDC